MYGITHMASMTLLAQFSITVWDISWPCALVLLIRIGPLDHVILHHWISFCGVIWSQRSMPTSLQALKEGIQHCANKIPPHLCKMVMKILAKECLCASKAVYVIPNVTLFYFLCTLWFNKKFKKGWVFLFNSNLMLILRNPVFVQAISNTSCS